MKMTFRLIATSASAAAIAAFAPASVAQANHTPGHSSPATAVRYVPFTQAAFDAAKAQGKAILVEVHAPWCPVCAAQQAGIAAAQADAANRGLIVFRIDFDSQKAVQRPLRVTRQSTLIAFNGARETGRLLGDTNSASIARLIATTRG